VPIADIGQLFDHLVGALDLGPISTLCEHCYIAPNDRVSANGYRCAVRQPIMGGDVLSRRKTILAFIVVLGIAIFLSGHALVQEKSIVIASTTSTQDSGLFEHLLPLFTEKTGITVKALSQGTSQALDTGRRGEADVVFVHAKSAEQRFLAEGQGVKRFPVMYNDFVLIGPKSDPAGIKGMDDVAKAFKAIKDKQATFISRGDHSGTHLAELALWNKDAGIDIEIDNGPWYESVGRGMDATLYMASAKGGYVLSDRGTWIHFKNRATCKFCWKAISACSTSMA
jgi:tungstate transport system substrate-binding protein